MKTISIREFQQNLYKHIKTKEDFVVTIRDVVSFEVCFNEAIVVTAKHNVVTKKPKENVVTLDNVTTNYNDTTLDPIKKIKTYACGCQKIQGDLMCAKHNRL